MIAYPEKPSWDFAFTSATHILRVYNMFVFAIKDANDNFENMNGVVFNNFTVIEEKPSNTLRFYSQKPSWSQAFKGATHILSVQDCFIFAINFGARGFKTEDGSILDQFCVIEEKPSNPVTIANTFRNKPDWVLAFVGATHIVSVNNLRLQKITYHFAKQTGEQFANEVGTPFTDFTVVEDDSKYPYLRGDGINKNQSWPSFLTPAEISLEQENLKLKREIDFLTDDRIAVALGLLDELSGGITNAWQVSIVKTVIAVLKGENQARPSVKIPMVTPVETTNHRTEQIRNKLTKFIDYDEGKVLRNELHEYAKKSYVRKFSSDQYLKFMNANECDFTINGAQSTNHPYYFTLFTVVSQHVMGDCVEECLDKAIYILKGENNVI